MKTAMRVDTILALGALALVACSVSGPFLPAPKRLAANGESWSEPDVERLERGRTLLLTRCADCHRTYGAEAASPKDWPRIAQDMGRRASLRPEEIDALIAYVVAASRAARDPR